MSTQEQKRDLVLAPGEYAYLQDETRGQIKTHVGPTVINQTAQDRPVLFDPATLSFKRCSSLEQAVVKAPIASEGSYLVLENPAKDNVQPEDGGSRPSPTLQVGRKVNIPGPCLFALWPGQRATVIPGHHLRSNQFLIVRVYNEAEAKQNWNKGVLAATTPGTDAPAVAQAPDDLTIGRLLLIKGTDVSFYIPPTGIEVVQDANGQYVREAETLEVLEYAILTDEDGTSRYEVGPQVVFPEPTETFYTDGTKRKFKATELSDRSGIHIKVIADYEDEDKIKHKVGDELFLTGDQASIYFPRKEHSIIRYGDKEKHFATAIPVGEARYVMNRLTGEIKTEQGPQMLLPDPRKEVIVRRILSDKQCDLWYPGNTEAKAYNQALRAMQQQAASTTGGRAGFISEGEVATNVARARKTRSLSGGPASASKGLENIALQSFGGAFPGARDAEEDDDMAVAAESFQRGTSYTQPRTVTLDTKYDGVPGITVWVGYAVLVVSKSGTRRVVEGPANVLLNYDESLEVLELSTGKPKTTDKLEKTVYLRTANNKVSDIVNVTTKDRVQVELKLSYRINFEGENPEKWFSVENYVKFACDHARSLLKGAAQKRPVSDFDSNGVDIVRDVLLGSQKADSRSGLLFTENNMRITDVEVLGISVADASIAKMLNEAQHAVVASNIRLSQSEKELEVTRRQQQIEQELETAKAETARVKQKLQQETLEAELALGLAKIAAELQKTQEQQKVEGAKQEAEDLRARSELARVKAREEQTIALEQAKQDQRLAALKAEVEGVVARFQAATPGFTEAVVALGNSNTLREVAQALSVQKLIGGNSVVDVISNLFKDTPLAGALDGMMKGVTDRLVGGNTGNGSSSPVAVATKR